MVPKLMRQSKWYENNSSIQCEDIVYFQKVENEWNSKWTVGKVIDTIKSKDGIVRRAVIEYRNSNEEESRTTDWAVRSLIKLFNIDDENWQHDMRKVEKLLEAVKDMSSVINPVLDTCLNSSSGSGVYAVLGYPQERCVMYAFAPLTAVCVSMMLVLE